MIVDDSPEDKAGLKEKDVIGWVTASMGSEVVTAHKTAASSSLLEIANPVVVTKTLS